ncbi:winged helix-turn-helix transcriptional regulator [Teredinibacter waterburyi]|uniref:winged helix-turn-helix transcriptional regulator n=1 Tax=Teredinibacter waterburyi TaxID=1500538 RepID=UPI00165EC3FF|nr:helix-turn-helix domain-containing protein [Teredinibacter waterburyi]
MKELIENSKKTSDCNGSTCPIKKALSLFEGKYSIYIFKELLTGKKRFSDFLKNIPGITSKTLNERLKYMAENGVVTRHSHPVIPPKVEYNLTERGRSLEGVILELKRFSEDPGKPQPVAQDSQPQSAAVEAQKARTMREELELEVS